MSARSADRRAADAETDETDPSVGPRAADLANLYRDEAPRLARYFARRGADDASDLVQESFARIAGLGARFGSVEHPAAYLGRIAANLLRHRARSALARSITKNVAIEDVALAGADPVANLEVRDQLRRLQRAIDRLRPKTRSVFLAHRFDGQSYSEIAIQMGISVKTVEWHMRKAIATLDRALDRRP